MSRSTLGLVLFISVCVFCTLYLPQPLLPLLASEYGVTVTDAALLISATLVPLAIAPLAFGYLTEAVSAKRVLGTALLLLAVNQALFVVADGFWWLVALRFLQGLLLPALFTALMTYCASMARGDRVRNAISYYIAATICGGFLGRLVGGVAGEHFHWRWGFALFAALLLVCFWLVRRLPGDERSEFRATGLDAVTTVLKWPGYAPGLLGLMLVFGVYSSLLTLLPFRLKALDPGISATVISMVYVGYLTGIVAAVFGPRLTRVLRGDVPAIMSGTLLAALGMLGIAFAGKAGIFVAMIATSAGFFLTHATLSAFLNHAAPHSKALVNGLYLTAYYSGGAVGAWAPAFVFRAYGWAWYAATLGVILLVGVLILSGLRRVRLQPLA